MTKAAVSFQGVLKKFKNKNGESFVIKFPNFWIMENKITAILGPSGAGKTTAAKIIGGIEKKDSGKVFIHDVLLNSKNQSKIRKEVAFVFQNFNLFPHMSVLNNILYAPIKVLNKDKKETINKANVLLKHLGLLNKKNSLPGELSIGQKQRVAIIRALMTDSNILIMDEPTASLDPKSIHDLINVIKAMKQKEITIIIVTHDLAFTKKVADYVVPFFKKDTTTNRIIKPIKIEDFFDKNIKNNHIKSFLKEYGALL